VPAIFPFVQEGGAISDDEMYRTFNMGIGMIWVMPKADVPAALALLAKYRQPASVIGRVVAGDPGVTYV